MTARFHVVTGGPGSGKTSLIEAMATAGFHHMPEAGRAIIRDQLATGGIALPWGDRERFAELMLAHEIRSYRAATALSGPVLFDRGIPDVIGYLRLAGLRVPDHVMTAARQLRYNRQVHRATLARGLRAGRPTQTDAGGGGGYAPGNDRSLS